MAESKAITLPLADEAIEGLRIGDHVEFSGVMYGARDAAHRRLIGRARSCRLELRGQVIYYVGPTPLAGTHRRPTTAMPLEYTPRMLERGSSYGKGGTGCARRRRHAVYGIAVGGTGRLIERWRRTWATAMRRLEIFPAIPTPTAATSWRQGRRSTARAPAPSRRRAAS